MKTFSKILGELAGAVDRDIKKNCLVLIQPKIIPPMPKCSPPKDSECRVYSEMTEIESLKERLTTLERDFDTQGELNVKLLLLIDAILDKLGIDYASINTTHF